MTAAPSKSRCEEGSLLTGLAHIDADLPNFSAWLFSNIEPSLGAVVLDAGAGVGTYTRLVLDSGREAVAIELEEPIRAELIARSKDYPGLRVLDVHDLTDRAVIAAGRSSGADSAICLNVLEHIEDDAAALANLYEILPPGGSLAALVPAHPSLFNTIDASVGHFRRYRRDELEKKLDAAGFLVDRLFYFNAFAIPGWILSGHILRRSAASERATRVFDRLVPMFRVIERWVFRRRVGISLVALCRKA